MDALTDEQTTLDAFQSPSVSDIAGDDESRQRRPTSDQLNEALTERIDDRLQRLEGLVPGVTPQPVSWDELSAEKKRMAISIRLEKLADSLEGAVGEHGVVIDDAPPMASIGFE